MFSRDILYRRDATEVSAAIAERTESALHNSTIAAEKALLEGYLYTITNEHRNAKNLLEIARKSFAELGLEVCAAEADRLLGFSSLATGDNIETFARLQRARVVFEKHNDGKGLARTLNWLVSYYFQTGEYNHALEIAEHAVELGEKHDDALPVANLTGNIGNVHLRQANHDAALEWYQRALEKHKEVGNALGVAAMTGNIGAVYSAYADFSSALEWYRRALALQEDIGNTSEIARILGNIANAYANTGDIVSAFEWERKALLIAEGTSDKRGIARITGNLGMRYYRTGNYPDAIEWLQKAIAIYESIGDKRGVTHISGILGDLYVTQGNVQEAEEILDTVFHQAIELHLPVEIAEAGFHLAILKLQSNNTEAAVRIMTIAEEQASIAKAPKLNVKRYLARAKVEQHKGNQQQARELYKKAIDESERIAMIDLTREAHSTAYTLEKAAGNFQEALHHIEVSNQMRDQLLGEQQQRRIAMLEVEHSVEDERKRAEEQRAQSERQLQLLTTLLPASVAKRLLEGETRIADSHENVSVLFLDLVGFTSKASKATPHELLVMLDQVFRACGASAKKHGVTTIKTIGDAYMGVCGAPDGYSDHALRAGLAATEIIRALPNLSFRIGIHCGPLIAGVIDAERIAYDIWGDTVNIAARMEQTSEPNKIHVSQSFSDALAKGEHSPLVCTYRGETSIKGKGLMHTYWLTEAAPLGESPTLDSAV
jgi:adenylate cyclase